MNALPGAEELTRLAADAAGRCGVDLDVATGELPLAQGVTFTV